MMRKTVILALALTSIGAAAQKKSAPPTPAMFEMLGRADEL